MNAEEKRQLAAKQFEQKAKEIHGDKYDYSLSNYKNAKTKIKIICPEHGEFEQIPDAHLKGQGCPFCGIEINTKNKIEKFKKIFFQKAKKYIQILIILMLII